MKDTQTHPDRQPRGKPVLDDKAFQTISKIAYEEAGLAISPGKSAMVHTRLARRLRSLNLASYEEYCALLESENGQDERRNLISALTTNVSHFFREEHHFQRLQDEVLPELFRKAAAGERIRFWSAGCSNGQEPYSIAAILSNADFDPDRMDVRILATDIDPNVIRFARRGIYDSRMIESLPDEMRERHFQPVEADGQTQWRASDNLRKFISFRELNLLRDWPMKGKFDVIFCRNVVIYFDQKTQDRLWQRFAAALKPGGWLFLGHSERVSDAYLDDLPAVGMTTYRRTPFAVSQPTEITA